tara:strand:+ start:1203 stop:1499 length:297 start_codon:yes stop_codon:yes gene_type:complete
MIDIQMTDLHSFFMWVLVCFSLTLIVTDGTIFEKWRTAIRNRSDFLGKLFSCPLCFGFWVGVLLGYTYLSPTNCLLLDGALGSGTSWMLYNFFNRSAS